MNAKTLCVAGVFTVVVSCDRKSEGSSSLKNSPDVNDKSVPAQSVTSPRSTNIIPVDGTDHREESRKDDALARREAELTLAASGKTVSIVELAWANNLEQIAKAIRPAGESKVLRHAATKEIVLQLLGKIDPHQLKIGNIQFNPAQSLVHVRIEEPVRLDLEYYFDASSESESELRLQSIHP